MAVDKGVADDERGRGGKDRPRCVRGFAPPDYNVVPFSSVTAMSDTDHAQNAKHGEEDNKILSGEACRDVLNVVQRATHTYIPSTGGPYGPPLEGCTTLSTLSAAPATAAVGGGGCGE